MVDSFDATLQQLQPAEGEMVTAVDAALGSAGEAFATLRDPADNLLGLCQEPRR